VIALAAAPAPVGAGCRDDGVIIGNASGSGSAGAGGGSGSSANARGGTGGGGGTDARGGTGGSGGSATGGGAGTGARGGIGTVGGAGGSGGTGGGVGTGRGGGAVAGSGFAGGGSGGTDTDGGLAFAWVDLSPCHFPGPMPALDYRTDSMTVLDPDRGKLIAYGGASDFSDLWEIDLATGLRTDRTTCAYADYVPDIYSALVYDAGRKRVVLFSNSDASKVREWDPVADVWMDRPAPSGSTVPAGQTPIAVYDANRGRVIVLITHLGDTSVDLSFWEWDGTSAAWTSRQQPALPASPLIEQPSLAFDADRNLVWGFGGSASDGSDRLWTWNVGTGEFIDLTPATRPASWPSARWGSGMVYDGQRSKLVLYGGSAASAARRDLWEWDPGAATWANRTAPGVSATGETSPPGVAWTASDYWSADHLYADPAHDRLVLFQESDFLAVGHSGAWLWDSARGTWSEPKADTTPALWPRAEQSPVSTAWDDDDRTLFLAEDGELWRWTIADARWEVIAWPDGMGAPNSLPQVDGAAIAYDSNARKLVMFGGYVTAPLGMPNALTDDLWLWDPATARLTTVSRPAGAAWPDPRRDHAMAYDPVRQRVLLFGGGKPEASRELWELDTSSTTWRDLSGAATAAGAVWPEARIGHALALDPGRNVLILRGGGDVQTYNPSPALDATWELVAGTTSWTRRADPSGSATSPPLAFMAGVGLLTLGPSSGAGVARELLRLDGTGGAWQSMGVPLPSQTAGQGFMGPVVGVGDRLLVLWAAYGDQAGVFEDQIFFHVWQWGPTP